LSEFRLHMSCLCKFIFFLNYQFHIAHISCIRVILQVTENTMTAKVTMWNVIHILRDEVVRGCYKGILEDF